MQERLPFWAAVTAALHLFVFLYMAGYKPELATARRVGSMCSQASRLVNSGRMEEAKALLEKATSDRYRSSPAAARAFIELGLHQLRYTQDFDQAVINLETVAKEFPEFMEAEEAEEYLQFIAKAGGRNLVLLYFSASGMRKRNKPAEALKALDQIVNHWPSSPVTPFALFQAYEIATHNLGDANLAKKYHSRLFLTLPSSDWAPLARIR